MDFKLFKGVDQDLEFKGLKAQYLLYMGGLLLAGLLLFTLLYWTGLPIFLVIGVPVALIFYASKQIFRFNRLYGKDGLMKKMTFQRVPFVLKIRSRGFIRHLKKKRV
jgi:hypothetical protein